MTKIQTNLVGLGAVAVIGAALGGYAYLGVKKPAEAEEQKKEAEAKLFTFEKEKVKKVHLLAQGATMEFERAGDGWALVKPVKADADKPTVDAIVDKMAELKATRWMDVDENAQKHFGLASPVQSVTLEVEGGAKHVLDLGATNAFDQSIYGRREGDTRAALLDSGARTTFDKSLFDAREKRVLVFEDKDLKKVAVTIAPEKKGGKVTEYVLVKEAAKWALEKPLATAADDTTVNQILNGLRNLRATRYATEEAAPADLKKHGLDMPRGKIVLTMAADNAVKTLDLGQVEEGGAKKIYAKRGEAGYVAEVAANAFDDLDKDVFALRDKTVVAFDREALTRVDFTALDGTQLSVKREKKMKEGQSWAEEEFTLTAPREAPAKKFKVSSLLYTLAGAKATAFAAEPAPKDLKKFGLDKPRVAAFYGAEGKLVGKLLVGEKKGDKIYAMAEGGPRVVELESKVLDEWPKNVEDLVEPPPAPPAPPAPIPGQGAAPVVPEKG